MSLFNLGRTDEYGNQRRIEHRGRNLRASRTGGVALRAQAKAAGVNVTANTSTGFRVSTTPLHNTRMALQNGRFVLKGRYGKGPTRLNLSKRGMSVSTRNELGSFNWFKPNRSSAKFAGIQLRGEKAAWIQGLYMLLLAAISLLQLVFRILAVAARLLGGLLGLLHRLALATPYAVRTLARRWRNHRLQKRLSDVATLFTVSPDQWSHAERLAGLVLVYAGWGRGHKAVRTAEHIAPRLDNADGELLRQAYPALARVSQRLEVARNEAGDETNNIPQACLAVIADRMARDGPPADTAEAILQTDEFALADGPRTRLQEHLLEVFTDFAGIRFQQPVTPDHESGQEQAQARTDRDDGNTINLNTASRAELESIPHIGAERAEQLIAMRPLSDISELTAIKGIGPGRLDEIRAHGVKVRGG